MRGASLLSSLLVAGCGILGESDDESRRTERIRSELGLVPPYHLISAGFVPDGGSGIAHFTDPHGTPLWVLFDGRMLSDKPRPLHVHVSTRGEWDGSRRLAFESAAESAVVDLLERAIRREVSVRRESTLLREERRARADKRWSQWHSSLTKEEERAWTLRQMMGRVETNRAAADRLRADRATWSRASNERVRRELGIELPTRLLDFTMIDDGGSAFLLVVDAGGESLLIVQDNRGWPARDSLRRPVPPPSRLVYLHAHPTGPGARRLAFNSPAESAVVDLVRAQVRQMVTVEEESSLVRDRRRIVAEANDPGYGDSAWHSRITPLERDVWALREFVSRIELRRARFAVSPRDSGWSTGPP